MLPTLSPHANPHLYGKLMQDMVKVLLGLDRNQEAHEAAADLVAFAKANCHVEDPRTLSAMTLYASACAELEDVLTIETRVLGRDPIDQRLDVPHGLRSALRI